MFYYDKPHLFSNNHWTSLQATNLKMFYLFQNFTKNRNFVLNKCHVILNIVDVLSHDHWYVVKVLYEGYSKSSVMH